jgi:hypothetical protein
MSIVEKIIQKNAFYSICLFIYITCTGNENFGDEPSQHFAISNITMGPIVTANVSRLKVAYINQTTGLTSRLWAGM